MVVRDDPRLLTQRDRDEVAAFREFLSGPDKIRLEGMDALSLWGRGEGPPPARLDREYGLVWRCAGMGV